ncbi:MAG: TonB-dependent receptor [Kiritimatiellae bacterium]|nr:TonB-dependent receptor [Kiritimatiellia bacterium]
MDSLTEDFIRERNPTDMNDLLRWVPGIETGGTSLLVRQPGLFSVRGMGGTEPAFDGVVPVGRGAGLFMDPFMMDRVDVVKGPIASLSGGAGAQQNNNGAGGAISMSLKTANFDESTTRMQENTSVGNDTWRQRALLDANQIVVEDRLAVRIPVSADFHSPAYANTGSQSGARPREQYAAAPSFVAKPNDDVTFGVKSMFVHSDAPSYIGIPVWRGKPGGGYRWRESSCRRGDRSEYDGIMVHPYVDWQIADDWLLKFGGAFLHSRMEQNTREPYTEKDDGLKNYFATGRWLDPAQKYQTTNFSSSESQDRSYNLYARAIWNLEELPGGFKNKFMAQPDFYYRSGSNGFGTPTSRYGATLQDSVGWGWFTLLGGLRCDYFAEEAATVTSQDRSGAQIRTRYRAARECAFSPRAGLTVQPLDWLVLFGNVSETRTPTLGYVSSDGTRPTDPWTARQLEGGLRLRPLKKLWLSASCYEIEQENTPVAEAVNNKTYYYFDGRNRSRGLELSLSGDITENWTVMMMYACNFYVDETKSKHDPGYDFERTPRHVATFNTSYRLHGWDWIEDVVVGCGYRFRSKSYATLRGAFVDDNLYFNPSHVFDVNASIPLKKFGGGEEWFLTLGVRNLFDERYFETARHYYECFAGEGRTFEIGIRGKF